MLQHHVTPQVILSINRFERKKNIGLAIEALHALHEQQDTLLGKSTAFYTSL